MEQQTRIEVVGGVIGAAVVAAVLVATVVSAAAQGPGHGIRHRGGPGGPGGPGRGGLGLNLPSVTDAQRQQIQSVVQSHREETRALVTRERAARQALRASAETGQVDQGQASELGAATAALAAARAQTHVEVLQVLTPEQREELTAKRDAMKAWRDARPGAADGRGRRGGRGNRPAPPQR
jgi:Spy/CpxP family protein refolding chaperone